MKTRQGFVSNSSSSSFIVVALPKEYKPSKEDIERTIKECETYEEECTEESILESLQTLKKEGEIEADGVLDILLKDYVIGDYDVETGGGGEDYIKLASEEEITRLKKVLDKI